MRYTVNLSNAITPNACVHVDSLEAASRAVRRTVETLDIGVSQTSASFGDVYEGLRLVARVSYNGRIWNLDGSPWK